MLNHTKDKRKKICNHCQLVQHLCRLYKSCLPNFKADSSSRWVTRCTAYLQTKRTLLLLFKTTEVELKECKALSLYYNSDTSEMTLNALNVIKQWSFFLQNTFLCIQLHFTFKVCAVVFVYCHSSTAALWECSSSWSRVVSLSLKCPIQHDNQHQE